MVCVQKCSQNCISIVDSGDSLNAVINDDICVHCNACRNVCPQNILVKKQKPITWYQGWAEEEIRKRSSSGGAASAIMKAFIESGGFVASCLFDMGNFTFTLTNDIEVLKCFRGSKYVKSNPGNIYEKIADKLKNHKVLFVGLPCQVAALKRYVKCYENLYTIDLICHGTPSRKLLDSYLNEKGYSLNSCLDVTFRNQTMFGLSVNGDKVCPYEKDDYTIAFLKSVCYTESCYSCQYASDERVSDVTLGDL